MVVLFWMHSSGPMAGLDNAWQPPPPPPLHQHIHKNLGQDGEQKQDIHGIKVWRVGVEREKGGTESHEVKPRKRPLFLPAPYPLSRQLVAVYNMYPPQSSRLRTTFYNTITVSQFHKPQEGSMWREAKFRPCPGNCDTQNVPLV